MKPRQLTLLCGLLVLLTCTTGCSDTQTSNHDKNNSIAENHSKHALSGYKQQLDKAKAIKGQLMQHDKQRRQALQAAEASDSNHATDNQ